MDEDKGPKPRRLKAEDGPGYSTFIESNGSRGLMPDSFTVDEAIETTGFGKFQITLSFCAGLAWMADAMELMVLSIIGAELRCEWNLNAIQVALITTFVFTGYMIGCPVMGSFADHYSRRKSLMFCACWSSYFGIISALSPTYGMFILLRLLVGVGLSGKPQAVTYYAEFLPAKSRGKCIVLLELFWALGSMLAVALAMWLIPIGGWELWLVVVPAPLLLFAIICLFLPTSPKFDLAAGKVDHAERTLQWIADTNNEDLPKGALVPEPQLPRGQYKDLFAPKLRRSTILVWILWFGTTCLYYGTVLMSTVLINSEVSCITEQSALMADSSHACRLTCKTLNYGDYIALLITSSAEIPGILVTALLVDFLGRKRTMVLELLLYVGCACLLFVCVGRSYIILMLFFLRALCISAFQLVFLYTPEIYPTQIRAIGIGCGCGVGRLGAIITPFIAQVLMVKSLTAGVGTYAAVAFLSALVTMLLPYETQGRTMGDFGNSMN